MRNLACWLGWPPGHLYESVTYRDRGLGALARVRALPALRTLTAALRRRAETASQLPRKPARHAARVRVPAGGRDPEHRARRAPRRPWSSTCPRRAKSSRSEPRSSPGGPWRGATVYCARGLGTRPPRRLTRPPFGRREGLPGAAGGAPWVEDLARQLEHELAPLGGLTKPAVPSEFRQSLLGAYRRKLSAHFGNRAVEVTRRSIARHRFGRPGVARPPRPSPHRHSPPLRGSTRPRAL